MDIRVVVLLSFFFITSSCEAHLVKHVLDHADRTVSGIANVFSGGILGGGLKLNFNAEINSGRESVPLEAKPHHHGGLLGLLHHNRHGPPPIDHGPPPIDHGPPSMNSGPPRYHEGQQGHYGGNYGYGSHSESEHQGSDKHYPDHAGGNNPYNDQNHQEQQGHYGFGGNHGYGAESEHQGSNKPHLEHTGSNIPFNGQNTNSYSYSYAEAGSFSSSNSEGNPHQYHNTPSKDKNTVYKYPAPGYDNSYPKYAHGQEKTDENYGSYSSESSSNLPQHDEQMNHHQNHHGGSYGTHSYNNNQGQYKHESDKNKPKEYERATTHKTDQKEINNDQPYYIPLSFEDNKQDREKVDVDTPDKDKFKRDENKKADDEEYSIDIRSKFDK